MEILEKLKKGLQRSHLKKLEDEDFFSTDQKYSAADLIVRRYLNDGSKSGFGMIKIKSGYEFILKNKKELIANNMLSRKATNNSGFELWDDYKIKF